MNGSEDLKRHLGHDTPKSVGMPRPVVALLSDFGSRDHYAGTMKGVILSICPDVALVDISHDIPPHAIQPVSYTHRRAHETLRWLGWRGGGG